MVKKKIGTWGKLAVFLIIVGLIIGGYFVIKSLGGDNNPFLSVSNIGQQCNLAGTGTTDNKFTCPSECDVVGWNTCEQQTGQDLVLFRTNFVATDLTNTNFNIQGKWIAYDVNGDGQLECFTTQTTKSPTCNRPFLSEITTPFLNNFVWKASFSEIFVQQPGGSCVDKLGANKDLRFLAGTGCELSPTSIPSYRNSGQEILAGGQGQSYICETPYTITNANGQVVKSSKTAYGGKNSGEYNTGVLRLTEGQSLNFGGKINWAVIDASQSCAIDSCNADKTGIIKCIEDSNQCRVKDSNVQMCNTGEVCVDRDGSSVIPARCESPVDIAEYGFQDAEGEDVAGYTTDQPIYFIYRLTSELASNAQVTFDLVDVNGGLKERKIESVNFPQTQANVIQFQNPGEIGNFKVIVKISYDGKPTTPQEFEFSVANEFSMEIIGSSAGTVKTIYTNAPAIIELRVFGGDGKFTTADTSVKATLIQGNQKTEIQPFDTKKETGIYSYYYNLPNIQVDSVLRAEASATKLGLTITKTKDLIVKPAFIDLTFTNVANLVDLDEGISKTIKFTTKDPQGDPVNVDSLIISVIEPSGKTEPLSSSNIRNTGAGNYEFDYSFNKGSGAYFFKVDASKQLFNSKSLTTPAINVIQGGGQGLECTENAQCGVGKICVSNQCVDNVETPTYIYIVWGLIFVLVVVVIIVVVRVARRPKKQQGTSITGLGDL